MYAGIFKIPHVTRWSLDDDDVRVTTSSVANRWRDV